MLENVPSAPSQGVKITIPLSHALRPTLPPPPSSSQSLNVPRQQQLSRVQPSRPNKASKMAKVLSSIEEDDDGTTEVPRRRKRRIEDEPEHLSNIPEDVERNPMALVKRRKKNQIQPSQAPPLLPLKPAHPVQIPPRPDSQSRPQSGTSTQLVLLPTVSQSCISRSAPQHQPQSPRSQPHAQSARQRDQTATPQSSRSHCQQLHDEDMAAFGIQAGLNNDDPMDAFNREDANMADAENIAVDDES